MMVGMTTHHAQIGIIHIPLPHRQSGNVQEEGPIAGPSTPSPLCNTDPCGLWDILDLLPPGETVQEVKTTLRHIIADEDLGAALEYRQDEEGLLIRVSLLPSDALGSTWKRGSVGKAVERGKWLSRLWYLLQEGWEEPGAFLMSLKDEDSLRMLDLYASVPSPPIPDFPTAKTRGDAELFERLEGMENPPGIKTALYQYQIVRTLHPRFPHSSNLPPGAIVVRNAKDQRSVSKMIQMETHPLQISDPRFTEFEEAGREGRYWVHTTGLWDIRRCPSTYELPRGGILCEQMGVGKTIMCLSLIVSTKHQPCQPPPHGVDMSRVYTVGEDKARLAAIEAEGAGLVGVVPALMEGVGSGEGQRQEGVEYDELGNPWAAPLQPAQGPTGPRGLVDICAMILRETDRSGREYGLPPAAIPAMAEARLYYEYPPEPECDRRVKQRNLTPKRLYLADTTLVVVPPILVPQWIAEISKHVENDRLSVYVAKQKVELPAIQDLIKFDIVLMGLDRFAWECSEHFIAMNGDSVLKSARWKRIILDEGHVASSDSTNGMIFASNLSIERRWMVSGTPTKHLQQGTETVISSLSPRKPLATERVSRKWTNHDLNDAAAIGRMMGCFLNAPPFLPGDLDFQREVVAHLRRPDGPSFGAVRRLKTILDALMVKHLPRDIDSEATLPPMTLSVVPLKFHPMQRITYNALAGLVASNVYTSNGEDQDYFLHPNNREHYLAVVRNLHLAGFWYTAPEMGIETSLRINREFLLKPGLSDEVRAALEEANRHFETALSTPGWSEIMEYGVSIPFEADNSTFPDLLRMAWSDSMDSNPDCISSHGLLLLRNANYCGNSIQALHLAGWDYRLSNQEEFHQEILRKIERWDRRLASGEESVEAMLRKPEREAFKPVPTQNAKKREAKGKEAAAHEPVAISRKSFAIKPNAAAPKKRKKKDELLNNLDLAEENARVAARRPIDMTLEDSRPRAMPPMVSTTSRSSKLNWIIRTILDAPAEDKFVIYGDKYEHGHLTEALDLFHISSRFVGNTSKEQRNQAIADFQLPDIRVCLLDTKLAARGLNLVVANRMIFIAPVWSADLQAQAIKRVHRIGQTRPTKIDILVTEGTFEQEIVNRSVASRTEDAEKVYSRQLIENPKFVYVEEAEQPMFEVPFLPDIELEDRAISVAAVPSATDAPSSPRNAQSEATLIDKSTFGQPPRKRLRVTFAPSPTPFRDSERPSRPMSSPPPDGAPPPSPSASSASQKRKRLSSASSTHADSPASRLPTYVSLSGPDKPPSAQAGPLRGYRDTRPRSPFDSDEDLSSPPPPPPRAGPSRLRSRYSTSPPPRGRSSLSASPPASSREEPSRPTRKRARINYADPPSPAVEDDDPMRYPTPSAEVDELEDGKPIIPQQSRDLAPKNDPSSPIISGASSSLSPAPSLDDHRPQTRRANYAESSSGTPPSSDFYSSPHSTLEPKAEPTPPPPPPALPTRTGMRTKHQPVPLPAAPTPRTSSRDVERVNYAVSPSPVSWSLSEAPTLEGDIVYFDDESSLLSVPPLDAEDDIEPESPASRASDVSETIVTPLSRVLGREPRVELDKYGAILQWTEASASAASSSANKHVDRREI